jgi:hypothetical protein
MKNINIKKLRKGKDKGKIIILTAFIILAYLLISIYFANHFFFNTFINGVNVSLKAHKDAEDIIKNYVKEYKLQLIERDGKVEEITGQDIKFQYNEKNSISKIYRSKKSFMWIISLLMVQKCYVDDLYIYDKDSLENKINRLNCLSKDIIEPQNASFKYSNGTYEVVKEVYGNQINRDKLNKAIKMSILEGKTKLDLDVKLCYENPKYTLSSSKIPRTINLLNKYVSTRIIYIFENEIEILDGNTINEWLSVDENLDVVISEIAVKKYIRGLSIKYDTVGIPRKFKTSMGKIVEVKGGLYGWKINHARETKALIENIKHGDVLEKEPIYAQKSLPRGANEIGNTYVEINITRQHLWFYKHGKLVAQGPVVSGNPNRGYSTVLGTYMLNYKQKGATLEGPDYEAEVTYWMPFFGNIGIHDASWRYSFGGSIYKRNGTHGCVNVSKYLAKKIFENIEDGTPIICYEE